MNISAVPVFKAPTVAVIATGDELLEPGSRLEAGKIINSNSSGLAAMLLDAGAKPILAGIAKDTMAATMEKIEGSLSSDILLVTGGASAGDHDYVSRAIEELGGEILFSGVSIKPGKPFGFAMLNARPVFIMPGNPVAAMVIFELFVRPLLLSSMGLKKIFRQKVTVTLSGRFQNKGARPQFAGANLVLSDSIRRAEVTGSQSSGRIASLTQANALLYIPEETIYNSGDSVSAMLLDKNFGVETEFQWD